MKTTETLIQYVKDNFNYSEPIKLEIGLDKVSNINSPTGNQSRYMHFFIKGRDCTALIADVIGAKISRARQTCGSAIIHGSGMDMGCYVQMKIYGKTRDKEPDMFDPSSYIYLGTYKQGKYC